MVEYRTEFFAGNQVWSKVKLDYRSVAAVMEIEFYFCDVRPNNDRTITKFGQGIAETLCAFLQIVVLLESHGLLVAFERSHTLLNSITHTQGFSDHPKPRFELMESQRDS